MHEWMDGWMDGLGWCCRAHAVTAFEARDLWKKESVGTIKAPFGLVEKKKCVPLPSKKNKTKQTKQNKWQ